MSLISFNRSSVPLVLAVLLISSGSVFLAENLTDTAAWPVVLPWWPVLLLVMGGWAIARGLANQLRGETAGVWLWLGEAVFALIVVGAGLIANFVTTTDWDLGFLEPPLVSTTRTVARTVDFTGDKLVADNPSGRIKVIGWDKPQTRVMLKMTAGGATLRSARRRVNKEGRPLIKRSGNSLRVVVKEQRLDVGEDNIPELTIRTPKAAALRLRAFGRITVSGMQAPVDVASRVGRIQLNRLAGPVRARGELGNINLSKIAGKVNVRNVQGDIRVADVSGPVAATNEGGLIYIARTEGDIKADNLGGPIEIADPGAAVNAGTDVNTEGHIIISANQAPLGVWRARSHLGPITVRLPGNSAFNLDAISEFGQIETSFTHRPSRQPGAGNTIKQQLNGGGPLVHLRTNNGNISVTAAD